MELPTQEKMKQNQYIVSLLMILGVKTTKGLADVFEKIEIEDLKKLYIYVLYNTGQDKGYYERVLSKYNISKEEYERQALDIFERILEISPMDSRNKKLFTTGLSLCKERSDSKKAENVVKILRHRDISFGRNELDLLLGTFSYAEIDIYCLRYMINGGELFTEKDISKIYFTSPTNIELIIQRINDRINKMKQSSFAPNKPESQIDKEHLMLLNEYFNKLGICSLEANKRIALSLSKTDFILFSRVHSRFYESGVNNEKVFSVKGVSEKDIERANIISKTIINNYPQIDSMIKNAKLEGITSDKAEEDVKQRREDFANSKKYFFDSIGISDAKKIKEICSSTSFAALQIFFELYGTSDEKSLSYIMRKYGLKKAMVYFFLNEALSSVERIGGVELERKHFLNDVVRKHIPNKTERFIEKTDVLCSLYGITDAIIIERLTNAINEKEIDSFINENHIPSILDDQEKTKVLEVPQATRRVYSFKVAKILGEICLVDKSKINEVNARNCVIKLGITDESEVQAIMESLSERDLKHLSKLGTALLDPIQSQTPSAIVLSDFERNTVLKNISALEFHKSAALIVLGFSKSGITSYNSMAETLGVKDESLMLIIENGLKAIKKMVKASSHQTPSYAK